MELSAAAKVMVTGVLCCDGDGDATGNTATRSTLLRQQVLSAAVATSSLLRWQRALLQKNQQRRALLQWLSDVDEVTFGDGTETATARPPGKMNYMKEGPKLDLKLNLSPPRATSPHSPLRSMEMSPPSSCVSREESPAEDGGAGEATSMMMLVGCPRCLMYVMLAQEDPKCPKCKSSVLLDFFHEERAKNSKKSP
nr:Gb:AAF02129.1, putative [Ipomoea batatas]